jgi:amino acid transporter
MLWGFKWYVLLGTHFVWRLSSKGSFFTTSRLIYAAGREGYLPALFGRMHPTRKTPLNATILQACITVTFILIGGGFRSLINFSVVASWGFYFLTVGFCDTLLLPCLK